MLRGQEAQTLHHIRLSFANETAVGHFLNTLTLTRIVDRTLEADRTVCRDIGLHINYILLDVNLLIMKNK